MIPLLLAVAAASGTLLLTSPAKRASPSHRLPRVGLRRRIDDLGLDDVGLGPFIAAVLSAAGLAGVVGFAVFGRLLPAMAVAGFAATMPLAGHRRRRRLRLARSHEAWPRMIEEIRVQTGSLGRSIPHALFEVGRRGPEELRPSFDAAHREWLLTTDLHRTFGVLKRRLADPTVDMTCETLLVAHELGGTDLDRRLRALADDRARDVHGRKDARSRQAGARFARAFVLAAPAGMGLAGSSIGNGRAAYATPTGQVVVLIALGLVAACWVWAGAMLRLPQAERVFRD